MLHRPATAKGAGLPADDARGVTASVKQQSKRNFQPGLSNMLATPGRLPADEEFLAEPAKFRFQNRGLGK